MAAIKTSSARRSLLRGLTLGLLPLALVGCASLGQRDALKVTVAGLEPLQGEGLELRFLVKLRVQNPNDAAVEFDGVALELELNGKSLASGVSDQKGVVPRFGETLLEVPLTVSAFAAVRQAMGMSDAAERGEMPYTVSGKLAGGLFGSVRFSSSGKLTLPRTAAR
ncbi:LEA type 2 family protein [Paucibacter sp. TC2R-5]|uniref:LEA type 2 family protein n=1 Tax=Paucibacter sp. TC2R-5 TaxID=2893555 RepID=UPI0021E44076|nr:LEA type 2 family protein [Paucibacter sp. TC2R-5]MCV2358281.1 LEA type 2 family protein [Paucibacter sp. TC2R-5]